MRPTLRNGRWTVHRHIPAAPGVVWALLTDLTAWPRWGPTVRGAAIDGGQVVEGARGTVTTSVGVPLPFVITDVDPGRRWSWAVAGVPATSHGVEPSTDGCEAWMSAPLWAPAYLPVLALALTRIDHMAGGR
ncbi:SRPBCC family protein [Nocardia jiangsuensis]|uniref:SRPBCC family protein n=1 Tax=Nocardia jiangsuensis TaxID=1691563 RepID=A0ABV8E0L4_9NOCA